MLFQNHFTEGLSNQKENKKGHLMSFWGVKLDSHKWFASAPFNVALNRVSHSDFPSDSDEKPAGPTKIKCLMCSGCYYKDNNETEIR